MDTEKIPFEKLNPIEQETVAEIYGIQKKELASRKIAYFRETSSMEKGRFSRKHTAHPIGSVLQALYKLKGKLLPIKFSVAVSRAFDQNDYLRTNYVYSGRRFLAVVLQKRSTAPEVVFNNIGGIDRDDLDGELRKHMEADIRHGFDLTYGPLIRFSVFHTGEDEYAIIVTAIEAVMLNFDVRKIFRAALELPEADDIMSIVGNVKNSTLAGPIKEYWSKILSDLPDAAPIPYYDAGEKVSDQSLDDTYLIHVPRDILSDLRSKAEGNKILLMSILQTAWGFLLQQGSSRQDVGYCIMVPKKEKGKYSTGMPSTVPIRLKIDGEPLVRELIMNAFKQFVVSQPYASMGREDILEIIGNRNDAFDHFLNFNDFFVETDQYTKMEGSPEGKLITQQYSDVRYVKLGISYRYDEHQVIVSIRYNKQTFPHNNVTALVKHYFLVLQRMLTDWDEKYQKFMEQLQRHWQAEKDIAEREEDSRAILQDALSKLTLLQECDNGITQLFISGAKLYTKFEGDRISGQEIEQNMIFVIKGKLARSIETGDGWYNTLDILKENSWVNETMLLPQRRCHMSAEVLTEQAVVLYVPLNTVQKLIIKSPYLAHNIIQHSLRQLEKYQRLWIQA